MKPVFVGRENIMGFYDSVNEAGELAYSLWFNNNILLQYPGEMNALKARDFLDNTLETYELNGWDKTLWLKFHPATKNAINRKTDVVIAQPVGFTEDAGESTLTGNGMVVYRGSNGGMNMEMFRAIKTLEDLPNTVNAAIEQKLTAYEERLKALEQPAVEEPSMLSQISGIVEKHPQIIESVFGLINRLVTNVTPIQPAAPLAINGTPNMTTPDQTAGPVQNDQPVQPKEVDNDKLNGALDRLETKMILDDDLWLLADYADKNPEQFNFLLTMLRNQK